MAEADFLHGAPTMIDYTPTSGAIAAGQVINVGNMCWIAHGNIANATLGAVATGGGVYNVTGAAQINPGLKVYWDDTNNNISTVAAGNMPFGKTVANCTAANATVAVLHAPYF
jgi:predicted RecA/RadA family phage recombinase